MMKFEYDLIAAYQSSFRDNFEISALTDYDSGHPTLTYGEMSERIARLHLLFEKMGVKPGDKIALCGKNSSEFAIVYMATLTYGTVLVPILHEFSSDDITTILEHSDSVLLFVNDQIFKGLSFDKFVGVKGVFSLDEPLKILAERDNLASDVVAKLDDNFATRLGGRPFGPEHISYKSLPNESIALINYTSGTSGYSKGVVLTIGNLGGNVKFGADSRLHYSGSRCLSFLPLAHAYGCAFDLLVPLAVGTHITFLGRTPTPRTLVKAFAMVRPNLVLCVPLILEKIYKNLIAPRLCKRSIRAALMIPGVSRLIYRQVRHKLNKAFGGAFEQVIVGGAPLNSEVEAFLKKIGFRFTVGYGMTECAPLISYTHWREYQQGSSGRALPGLMEAKIGGEVKYDAEGHMTGEIMVRGVNVMSGYYKRQDLSELALTEEGWLHTGDMGFIGDDGSTIYIRGRYKTMILGPSGQNIYPEAIENRLNVHPFIVESIVVDREGRITALVYLDNEAMKAEGIEESQYVTTIENTIRLINKTLAPFERISITEVVSEPFEKTPKKSIKRYLYR